MRWILAAAAIFGFLIALASQSPGLLGLGVLLALICGIGAAFAFIDMRIQATSRSEYMTPGELDALKSTLKSSQPADPGRLPPPAPR